MKNLMTIMAVFLSMTAFGQKKFTVNTSTVVLFDKQKDKVVDEIKSDHTFIININERGDVAHLYQDGNIEIYRKFNKVNEGETVDGYNYQIISVINKDGDVLFFQLFDDNTVRLMFTNGSYAYFT